MEIALTKMSSKGQIVIPVKMRKDFQEGEKLLIIEDKGQLILKKSSDFEIKLKEDLDFANKTNEALKRIEKGKGIKMDFDDFINEMKEW